MNFSSHVGGRVLEERKRLGLSQAVVGELCGVSREMWGKYERGKAVMGTEVLSRFVLAGADALFVLTGQRSEPEQSAISRREAALLDNYRHSSHDGRDTIEKVALFTAEPSQELLKKTKKA